MRIKKILNNNVVITEQANGSEVIARGKGLAFQKRRGDELVASKIEKIYVLDDQSGSPELLCKLQSILAQIDSVYLDITDQIVTLANDKGIQLEGLIYLNLPDHLSTAVKRMKEGVVLHNRLLSDFRRFYPKEFEVGKEALCIIEEKTGEILPLDEAGFIAAHLINASMGAVEPVADDVLTFLAEVQSLLEKEIPDLDTDSAYYDRFMTHLKYFAERMIQHEALEDDDDLVEMIANKYPEATELAIKIQDLLPGDEAIGTEEQMYLTIHLAKLMRRSS